MRFDAARTRLVLGILSVTVVVDQVTKIVTKGLLFGRDAIVLGGDLLRLAYAENRGAFLSLGASLPPFWRDLIFIGGVGVVLAMMTWYLLRDQGMDRWTVISVSLVVGGGIGNLIDRLIFGYVRDFANVGIGGLRTGIFNVADMAITAGAILMGVAFVQHLLRERAAKRARR